MLELSCRVELQQLPPKKCRVHHYTNESRRRPYSETLQHVQCVDCGVWTFEARLTTPYKEAFLLSHGWAAAESGWTLPEQRNTALFATNEAYDLALELAK